MDWYPWHPSRYREKTLHLTAEQDGIYRRLIDHYMETRKPLPDNDLALARIAGVDMSCFEHASSIIRAFFKQRKEGFLNHQTCDEMLNEQDDKAKFRTERARIAAEKRWSNQDVTESSNANSTPNAMLGDATVNSNSKHIGTNVPITRTREQQPEHFPEFWDLYPRQRRGSKDKALLAYKAALKRGNTEQQIINGVKTYAASSDVTRGYAKGCAAWLNDDGFNNDYKPVGVQDRSPSGANRGFDALATAAAKISENLDHEAEQLLREKPVLYFQRYGDQPGGRDHIAGSLETPKPKKHYAALPGTSSNEEGGTDGHEQ